MLAYLLAGLAGPLVLKVGIWARLAATRQRGVVDATERVSGLVCAAGVGMQRELRTRELLLFGGKTDRKKEAIPSNKEDATPSNLISSLPTTLT
jgi:hypothetical protein